MEYTFKSHITDSAEVEVYDFPHELVPHDDIVVVFKPDIVVEWKITPDVAEDYVRSIGVQILSVTGKVEIDFEGASYADCKFMADAGVPTVLDNFSDFVLASQMNFEDDGQLIIDLVEINLEHKTITVS